MKILVLSNLYPPFYIGGYEIMCKTIVDGLKEKGHDIKVLTSSYGSKTIEKEKDILRVLSFDISCNKWKANNPFLLYRQTKNDLNQFNKVMKEYKPALVYIWGMYGISKRILNEVQKYKVPILFDLHDEWLANNYEKLDDLWIDYWKGTPKKQISKIVKVILGKCCKWQDLEKSFSIPKELFKRAIFVSEDLKNRYIQKGVIFEESKVIYNGIPFELFTRNVDKSKESAIFKLLFVGQVAEHKGVHTILKGLDVLRTLNYNVELTIVGTGSKKYMDQLHKMAKELNITNYIHFVGKKERNQLSEIYNNHDCFVSSSEWPESFILTILEAMACGLPVITTATGGTKEIARHQENATVYTPGDSQDLANKIEELIKNRKLAERIRENGYIMVQERFSEEQMIENRYNYLKHLV